METLTPEFDKLAATYIQAAKPHATPLEVGNAIARLRAKVEVGEIALGEVLRRLRPTPLKLSGQPSFGDMARACRDTDGGRLSERERAFVRQMCHLGFGPKPSPRQADWLSSIFDRLRRRAA